MENKINSNVKVAIVAAILVGVLSMVAIHKYISVQTASKKVPETTIMIASGTIEKDEEFKDSNFSTTLIPANAVSNMHVVLPNKDSRDFEENFSKAKLRFTGRKSSRPIAALTPIFWIDLDETPEAQLDDLIPQNNRAVTIPVDNISSVSNFIRPGSKVDIALTLPANNLGMLSISKEQKSKDDDNNVVTIMIMQNIPVIAVGKNYKLNSTSDNTYNNITLNVTSEEALLLIQARTMGVLNFMLRNLNDKQVATNINSGIIRGGSDFMQLLSKTNQERRKNELAESAATTKVGNKATSRSK